jgi:hypothetical protein
MQPTGYVGRVHDSGTHEAARFSDELEAWLRGDSPKTLGELGRVFGDRSFAATILMLMFVPALPLPTGGVTHVFELITIVLGAEMVAGRRTIWLPDRWQRRELGATITGKAIPFMVRWIRRAERFSHRRGAWLFGFGPARRLLGLVFIALAAAAAVAPPFSGLDTVPSMGAIAVALSIILEDVVVLAIGIVLGVAGVLLIITLGAAAVHLFGRFV